MRNLLIAGVALILFFGCAKTPEEKELHIKDKNITIRLEGAVYPYKKQVLIADVGGYVQKVFVNNGDRVHKGDKIYAIDKTPFELRLKTLQTELQTLIAIRDNYVKSYTIDGSTPAINLAALELKKVAFLRSKGYLNDFEANNFKKNYINALFSTKTAQTASYEKIKTINKDIATRQNDIEKVKYDMHHADGYAIIDGIVTALRIQEGEKVGRGDKVCTIINLDKVIVKAGFATGLLPFIHKGERVRIDFVTTPPYHTFGTINRINPIRDPKFDRLTLEIILPNHNYILQENTRALVTIPLSKKEQELVKKYFIKRKDQTVLEIKGHI